MSTNEEKQTGTIADAGKVFHEGKLTTYVSGLKYFGVDDLRGLYPYYQDEWTKTFHPEYEITEEDYLKDTKAYERKVANMNASYIRGLKMSSRFAKPYVERMTLVHNPIFDDPKIELKGTPPLESYRMIFLNDEDTKTE